MEAGVTDHVWSLEEMLALLDWRHGYASDPAGCSCWHDPLDFRFLEPIPRVFLSMYGDEDILQRLAHVLNGEEGL